MLGRVRNRGVLVGLGLGFAALLAIGAGSGTPRLVDSLRNLIDRENVAVRCDTVADLATLPTDVRLVDGQLVQLGGRNAVGDGGGQPLIYHATGRPTEDGVFFFDGPGADDYYEAVEQHIVIAERAGLVGDNSTDNYARFQAIVDSIIAGNTPCREIRLTTGKQYLLSEAIVIGQLSGGAWLQTENLTISSTGSGYYNDGTTGASPATIYADSTDAPAIIIQNGRNITLHGLRIRGKSNFATDTGSAFYTAGTTNNYSDRLNVQANFNPVTNAARDNRYSPSCCIAIDPFGSSITGANRYPDYGDGEYVGTVGSANIRISHCALKNANVGILVGAGSAANSSEIDITHTLFQGCMYGVSTCHRQCKNINLDKCGFVSIWGCAVGNIHGAQLGVLPGMSNTYGVFVHHIYDSSNTFEERLVIESSLWEIVMQFSPSHIGPQAGQSGGYSGMGICVRDCEFSTGGTSSNTEAFFTVGIAPFTAERVSLRTDSTRQHLIAVLYGSWGFDLHKNWGDAATNVIGGPWVFRHCNFQMPSASSLADTLDISGEERWIEFDHCTYRGAAVAPINTQLKGLHGRGVSYPRKDARTITIPVFAAGATVATGDGKAYFLVTPEYNGAIIVGCHALVGAAGTTGTSDVQIARVRSGTPADVLSTKMTIDTGETDTLSAAAASAISTTNDDLATGDIVRVDVDAVSTTPPTGLWVQLELTP